MKKPAPKMSALVVSAIRNLRELRGSTSKEIMKYIMSQYNSSEPTLQKKMYAALKRGLAYGILKKSRGQYTLNTDSDILEAAQALAPLERNGRRRRRRRGRGRGRRRGRRGRRSRMGRKSRGRSRRGKRRRRRRRRLGSRSTRTKSWIICPECDGKRRNTEEYLKQSPVEENQEEVVCCYEKKEDRQRQSKTPNCSPSRSQSTVSSDQEADDRQMD